MPAKAAKKPPTLRVRLSLNKPQPPTLAECLKLVLQAARRAPNHENARAVGAAVSALEQADLSTALAPVPFLARAEQKAENLALRKALAACDAALDNGLHLPADAPLDFLMRVPESVKHIVQGHRAAGEKQRLMLIERNRQILERERKLDRCLPVDEAAALRRKVAEQQTKTAGAKRLAEAGALLATSLQECSPEPMDMSELGPMQSRRAAALEAWSKIPPHYFNEEAWA